MCNDIYKITGKCCQNFLFSDVMQCLPVKIRGYRPENSGFRSVSNGYRFLNLNLNFVQYLPVTGTYLRFTDTGKSQKPLTVGPSVSRTQHGRVTRCKACTLCAGLSHNSAALVIGDVTLMYTAGSNQFFFFAKGVYIKRIAQYIPRVLHRTPWKN